MNVNEMPENPYILLTPGPLSTAKSVKSVMLRDWCTWDEDYHIIVQEIRDQLVSMATEADGYTSVLMQGSGTFSVEATLTTAVPAGGKLLVLANGAYGLRMAKIAQKCRIPYRLQETEETEPTDLALLSETLAVDPSITHVAVVHCETTTGMLNPIEKIGRVVKSNGTGYIVDAMSSFGGITLDLAEIQADFMVSSANKCIQGVPGFGFVIARKDALVQCAGNARSLSLDLHDQWETMERHAGKWRFTSPTHTVRAFAQALADLKTEGGIAARQSRYQKNHAILVEGMRSLGFKTLLADALQSHIITAFHSPEDPAYEFAVFYRRLKEKKFVIYPGKVTDVDTFRIGNIGDVHPGDMNRLIKAVEACMYWTQDKGVA